MGVHPEWAYRYLRAAFENCAQHPHTMELYLKSPEYELKAIEILKRMGTNHPTKVKWFCDEPRAVGDIFPEMSDPYSSNIRHSYSNQACPKEVLLLGTTHVAAGFVDLGMLLEADLADPPKPEMDGPLCFLGVETSPYAVAKTLVIWEMIRQSQRKEHLRYAMQAWFSATLEEEAEIYLKKILVDLCDSEETRHSMVDYLLRHWRDADKMSLQKARSLWANVSTIDFSFIAFLERKQDRIDMAKYELTGDFGFENSGKLVYGNVMMLDCPEGTPSLRRDETVFSVLNWNAIASSLSQNITTFEASQQYIMERLSKVASWARQNMVTIRLICDEVQNVTELIASTKPWTMSWSNLLDYFDYSDFHRLAQSCSSRRHTAFWIFHELAKGCLWSASH